MAMACFRPTLWGMQWLLCQLLSIHQSQMENYDFDFELEEILENLVEDCKKQWLYFDVKDLYRSLERDTQLSINSGRISIEDVELLSDRLPGKFWVYRNYLWWWISGGIWRSEVDTKDERADAVLETCLDLFYDALEAIEHAAFSPETERGSDRFQGWLRVR